MRLKKAPRCWRPSRGHGKYRTLSIKLRTHLGHAERHHTSQPNRLLSATFVSPGFTSFRDRTYLKGSHEWHNLAHENDNVIVIAVDVPKNLEDATQTQLGT